MIMKPLDVIKCVDESMEMLFRTTINYVAEHQLGKGFINTETNQTKKDIIWAIVMDSNGFLSERQVKAVKVEHNNLMVLIDDNCITYTDDDIKADPCDCWYLVQGDDYVYYYPTLYSIASNINQFI